MEAGKASISVRGTNILQAPLLETNNATAIEFRDGFGELNAIMVKVLGSDEMWGLVTREDEDWHAVLTRFGYLNSSKAVHDIIKTGL